LTEGDLLCAEVLDEGDGEFRVRLRKIDPDQAWFWTPQWQAKLQEAEEDLAKGRTTIHYSDDRVSGRAARAIEACQHMRKTMHSGATVIV
jgi:hypothetical protein